MPPWPDQIAAMHLRLPCWDPSRNQPAQTFPAKRRAIGFITDDVHGCSKSTPRRFHRSANEGAPMPSVRQPMASWKGRVAFQALIRCGTKAVASRAFRFWLERVKHGAQVSGSGHRKTSLIPRRALGILNPT
jgi:hypothetical protein